MSGIRQGRRGSDITIVVVAAATIIETGSSTHGRSVRRRSFCAYACGCGCGCCYMSAVRAGTGVVLALLPPEPGARELGLVCVCVCGRRRPDDRGEDRGNGGVVAPADDPFGLTGRAFIINYTSFAY
eukprot:scaffold11325_cov56-Attheya_sp.AAC.6